LYGEADRPHMVAALLIFVVDVFLFFSQARHHRYL